MKASSPIGRKPAQLDIFLSLPMTALVIDPGNRIADANMRSETLFNMARSAIVGSDIGSLIRFSDALDLRDIWHTSNPLAAYDLRVDAGRSLGIAVDVMIAPIPEHEGWRTVAIHSYSQAQKIAQRRGGGGSRSAMGAAAILAHEIKNPLSGIRGAAQLLDTGHHGVGGDLTQLICNEVDRIAALIDRMQDFTNEVPLPTKSENIYPLLDHAVELAKAGFARDVTMMRDFDPSLPNARINAGALLQVLLNLLKNAAEALDGQKDAQIRISTAFRHGVSVFMGRERGSAALPIEIQVSDNGPGVPEHIRDDLFSPFISTKRDGQGLGLALVEKLVRDMNGLVQYERDEEAERSIFRILLPLGGA